MLDAGSRTRSQPPPPAIVFEALTEPDRDPARQWLRLLDDEQPPRVLSSDRPQAVVWSSLWPNRSDAQVHFDIESDGAAGTQLRWTLLVDEPLPGPSQLGHLRKRLNELINRDLRLSFGQ